MPKNGMGWLAVSSSPGRNTFLYTDVPNEYIYISLIYNYNALATVVVVIVIEQFRKHSIHGWHLDCNLCGG